uniref:DH domain-containing protein n=1 Tax=Steinernema glaseri TaxID=37863 RepID=A0A1I7ZUV1_9BILA
MDRNIALVLTFQQNLELLNQAPTPTKKASAAVLRDRRVTVMSTRRLPDSGLTRGKAARGVHNRRRSDVNLSGVGLERRHRNRSTQRPSGERHFYRQSGLRKTSSEPSVERSQQLHVQAIRQLLDSFPIVPVQSSSVHDVWATPRQSLVPEGSSSEELMSTDIEELREAAESIQSLQRVLKQSEPQEESGMSTSLLSQDSTLGAESESEGGSVGTKGITTHLGGHPRGVMQFLPSVNLDTYAWSKSRRSSANDVSLFRRKTSMPETYHLASFHNQQVYAMSGPQSEQTSPRGAISARRTVHRASDESEIFPSGDVVLHSKGVDSIAGEPSAHSGRRSTTPIATELAPGGHASVEEAVTSLAAAPPRQGLEHLVQKYMRPLKQPLECTLIDTQLVDKIFYRIPEILAHHQVLMAALSSRIECWQSDTPIGDVLLAHFTKRSMIETYEAFVDNFKFAKQAIVEARQKPAFEKYYMRCRRDHRNKLDLDSLLILPIQRVPRYELILKQIVKHTPVEHRDYDKLLRVQKEIHDLALSINRQREENEQMEQRLREIEAIVDGLEDLVSTGRTFVRYDLVTINGASGKKQRCLFMMSDQLIVTSVRKKAVGGPAARLNKSQSFVQSPDFLDKNRFKLLIKISMDDVDIGRDTLSVLQETEKQLTNAKEDEKIISKMMDLAKLLKNENTPLTNLLEEIHSERKYRVKCLEDQMNSNPELTTVHLQVTTFDGVETLTVEFPNADKRTIWENAFLESKSALSTFLPPNRSNKCFSTENLAHVDQPQVRLKSIIAHRTRPGLIFSTATSTFGKTAEGAPNVWACSTDKFASQVAIVNVNGEPTVESCTGIGNSAIVAVCPVPAPSFRRRKSMIASKAGRGHSRMELDSCSSDSDVSDADASSSSAIQSTIWIGNEDGELYVFNYLDNVRLKAREKMNKLSLPVQDIAYVDENVFISTASASHSQLLCFHRGRGMSGQGIGSYSSSLRYELGPGELHSRENGDQVDHPQDDRRKKCQLGSSPSETVSYMCTHGSTIFVSTTNAATVRMFDVFSNSFEPILEFSVSHVINKTLSVREDIIRQHKMGCLRISSLLCCRNMLWIGTSAGLILHSPIQSNKTSWTPTFTVCQVGHAGPCRFLTTVNVSAAYSNFAMDIKKRRMSLNAAALQNIEQMYIISGGTGVDHMTQNTTKPTHEQESIGVDDAVNHLIFWQL